MSTLLLRLCGPHQAWGSQSRFTNRDTEREPTKSGVLGLLCAALGKPRSEAAEWRGVSLAQLAALQFGVRIDRPGRLSSDYQTAGGGDFPKLSKYGHREYGVRKASGQAGATIVSNRFYLADAGFLAGVEGDTNMLEGLLRALTKPRFPIYLGRKAFVPTLPVYLPLSEAWGKPIYPGSLLEALGNTPFLDSAGKPGPRELDIVFDGSGTEGELRFDVPIDFARRQFIYRRVSRASVPMPEVVPCSWRV
jgi:CRISPR system Cascade subunit CasD